MKIIGLTGGIASGKSTVSNFLREQNIPVFDADKVATDAAQKGTECFEKIVKEFGQKVVDGSGEINRKALATIVFNDKKELKKLEAITHTYVWQGANNFLEENKNAKIVVLDVPLLIECGWQEKVDEVWLVAISEEEQIKRAIARSKITEEEVRARIKAQMPLEEKKKHATVILDNSKSLKDLEEQILKALK